MIRFYPFLVVILRVEQICCIIFDFISISVSSNIKIAEETKNNSFTSELSKYFNNERQAREIFILKLNLNCLFFTEHNERARTKMLFMKILGLRHL